MQLIAVTFRGLLALALCLMLGSVASAASLTPHSAVYKIKISVLSGRLNTRLMATDAGYEAIHKVVPKGLARLIRNGSIEEASDFAANATGVRPTHYRSSDTLSSNETRADVDFDWSTGTISGTVNDAEFEDVIDDLAYDRVSIQYQLMHDLLNGGASDVYILFDIDVFKTLNVSTIGSRQIKTRAGEFEAIGIQHRAAGSSRVTTLWCVEQLDYLPVMIEQHRDGKLGMRATLIEYTPEPL